jgi:hypothetical protein
VSHSHFFYAILLLLCLAAAGSAWSAKVRAVLGSVYPVRLASGIGVVVVLFWVLAVYVYLMFPGYFDHVQPAIASVSWFAVHGGPIWPNWETGDAYGFVYGPMLFLVTGVFLLADASIFMSKLPGLAALLGAVACLWCALRLKKAAGMTTFLLIVAFLTALDPRLFIPYESRADSFLILIGAALLPVAFEWPALPAAIGVGVLAGLGAGFKAHGILYAIPAALAVAARTKTPRECVRFAAAGGGAAIAAILLPFAAKAASACDYLRYLLMSAHHGLSLVEFSQGLVIVGSLAAPLFAVSYWRRPALGRPERWFLIGLGVAVALTLVIASKPGAGSHHLWPLFPACFYAMACILSADSRLADSLQPQNVAAVVVLALFVTYAAFFRTYEWNSFRKGRIPELAKIAAVENILRNDPAAQFGASDDLHYDDSYYGVLGAFQGAPRHLDMAVWMDLSFAGFPESIAARAIENCSVRTWVLPLGEPFQLMSLYTNRPLFSDEFREEFRRHYTLVQRDEFYQVWKCK